jgi:hypothetical protein
MTLVHIKGGMKLVRTAGAGMLSVGVNVCYVPRMDFHAYGFLAARNEIDPQFIVSFNLDHTL